MTNCIATTTQGSAMDQHQDIITSEPRPSYAINLPHYVAFVDIETYSLAPNAVVDEVGVIITNWLPVSDNPWSLRNKDQLEWARSWKHDQEGIRHPRQYFAVNDPLGRSLLVLELKLEVLEQILVGRVVDQDTMKFRRDNQAANAKKFKDVEPDLHKEYTNHLRSTLEEARRELKSVFNVGVAEVWMQHPQFDKPRIANLLGDGVNVPWWGYRAERDAATLKAETRSLASLLQAGDPYLQPNKEEAPSHQAVEDCFYMMWMLGRSRAFMNQLQIKSGPWSA